MLVTASAGFPGVADEMPVHQSARVMVILPAYNEGPIIEMTVRNLLSAGYEVIVVDDGSQDGTAAVVTLRCLCPARGQSWTRRCPRDRHEL